MNGSRPALRLREPGAHRAARDRAGPLWTLALLAVAALMVATAGGLFEERVDATTGVSLRDEMRRPASDTRVAAADTHTAATDSRLAVRDAPPLLPTQRFATIALDARQLVANVAMARLALGAEMMGDALDHVQAAIPIAERLIAGHAAGTPAWLPVQDDERVVHTLDDSLAHRHEQPLLAAEAHAVRTQRTVDPQHVLAELQLANRALERGDDVAAAAALEAADASVVAETNVLDLPLERVRDNLVLARELAADRDYGSAADALGFARAALADAELADASLRKRADAIALRHEIDALQARIGPVEPAGIRALRDRLHDGWTTTSAWLRTHAP